MLEMKPEPARENQWKVGDIGKLGKKKKGGLSSERPALV
jgi:hypothetical protein